MRRIGAIVVSLGRGGALSGLLRVSGFIDAVLAWFGRIAAWAGLLLVLVVVYDVVSRYAGVPKPFGLNSTKIQESEYWLHSVLFAFMIGYAYTRQAHVRIDLVRESLPLRVKYMIEMLGCLIFLIPYACLATYYCASYAYTSFLEDEVSKSVIGLSNIWILKATMPIMFALMGLAGVSQFLKSLAGYTGALPREAAVTTLGGDH